jgi:exodeoxyribonuclease VII small subunit
MPKARPDQPDTAANAANTVDETLPYEDAVEELESIVEEIESGAIGLEQSIRRYERGAALLKHCRAILDQAEQRITELDASSLGGASPAGDPDA